MFIKNSSRKQQSCASTSTTKKFNFSRLLAPIAIVTLFAVASNMVVPARAKTSLRAVSEQFTAASTLSAPIAPADFPTSGWQTATPQEVGMDPVKFASAMNLLPSPSVVIRNGRIVGQKGDIARTGYIWSGSKSLTALIFARLLQQGRIANYDAIVPNSGIAGSSPATFRHFLSMTSDYKLSPYSPGNHFAYNNGGVHFYSTYIKNTFYPGKTEVQMLREAFATALGFQDPLSYNTSGFLSGWDGGWSMSTRDLARVAYLVLRNGNWNSQQLLPASFINDLYSNKIPATATQAGGTDQFHNESPVTPHLPGAYSFGFWLPQRTDIFGSRYSDRGDQHAGSVWHHRPHFSQHRPDDRCSECQLKPRRQQDLGCCTRSVCGCNRSIVTNPNSDANAYSHADANSSNVRIGQDRD